MTTGSSAWLPSTMTRGLQSLLATLEHFPGRPGRAERLLPGPAFPALPDRGGPGRRRLPRRRHRGAGRRGAAGARRGRSRPVHRAGRRCAGPPLPPPRSCLPRAHRARRHREDHQAAAPARPGGDRAGRQRALFTSRASTPAFITALARATLSGYEPARPRPPTARAGPGGSAMALRESPAGKPVAGAAAQRPGPGPRAGPDGDPGQAGAGDRRPGPGHRCGAERRVGRCRGHGRRGLLAAAGGEGDPRDDPRSHGAAAPAPGLSTP